MEKQVNNRLYFLDHLKVALTMLVVAHHAGQPYGGSNGFWFFKSGQTTDLGGFFAVNAAFFMTLFFMISGYFLPASYDRKGASVFLKDRLKRIGIPLVVGFLLIIPPLMYAYYINYRGYPPISFWDYLKNVFFGFGYHKPPGWTGPSWPDLQFGHLWFLEHLLFYTIVYTLLRELFKRIQQKPSKSLFPKFYITVLFAILLSLITFLVRIWYPIDRWVGFLGVIQTEFAHVPQYLSFFIIGIIAYRKNWMESFPSALGKTWMSIGAFLAVLFYIGYYTRWFVLFNGGGFNLGSLIYSFYDTFLCTGLCIGLTYLFRKYYNRPGIVGKELAANTFTVYIIHVPVVVLLQYALGPIHLFAFVKFIIVAVAGIVISFLISWKILRVIPFVRAVL